MQGEPSSLDGDNGETILEKDSGVHLNDTSTTCELHMSNSHAESLAKSAELQVTIFMADTYKKMICELFENHLNVPHSCMQDQPEGN